MPCSSVDPARSPSVVRSGGPNALAVVVLPGIQNSSSPGSVWLLSVSRSVGLGSLRPVGLSSCSESPLLPLMPLLAPPSGILEPA